MPLSEQCGKTSFGTAEDDAVSIFGQGHDCIAESFVPRHATLGRMITKIRRKSRSCVRFHVNGFLSSRRTIFPIHWRYAIIAYGGIRTREKEHERLWVQALFGIHFGISSCTAVKDGLKHTHEVTLQAYFTILSTVFHGKKLATMRCIQIINKPTVNLHRLKYSSRFKQPRFASENGIFPKMLQNHAVHTSYQQAKGQFAPH